MQFLDSVGLGRYAMKHSVAIVDHGRSWTGSGYMLTSVLTESMSVVTDGLHMIDAQPSNHGDTFVEC